jgi:crotonobetainyl-CoA:carnitine CoA-transferase CaiB-like acyl-CoA transferase
MEWTLDLVKLGLPAGPIFNLEQVFTDPHVNQSGMVEEVDHPELGRLRLLANPIRMESLNGNSVRTAPPILGADSRSVLSDFGLSDSQINQLIDSKVVHQI